MFHLKTWKSDILIFFLPPPIKLFFLPGWFVSRIAKRLLNRFLTHYLQILQCCTTDCLRYFLNVALHCSCLYVFVFSTYLVKISLSTLRDMAGLTR